MVDKYIIRKQSRYSHRPDRFEASIRHGKRAVYLGTFPTLDQARAAQKRYASEHGIPLPKAKR